MVYPYENVFSLVSEGSPAAARLSAAISPSASHICADAV